MGPVYVAEITPITAVRGPMVGYLMGFACTATALAYWMYVERLAPICFIS